MSVIYSDCEVDDVDDAFDMWTVIETPADFCVVPDSSVLHSGSDLLDTNVGDKVRFKWSKFKTLEGVIRFISSDYGKCTERAAELNREAKANRKQDSFHAERPRTAAVAAKHSLMRRATSPPSKKARSDSLSEGRARQEEGELLNSLDSDDSDLASTVATIDPPAMKRIDKMALIKKLLQGLDSRLVSQMLSDNDERLQETQPTDASQATPVKRLSACSRKSKAAPMTPHKVHHGMHNGYSGTSLLFPEGTDGAIEVYEKTSIYCCPTIYSRAENATSATMVARRLLEGVFTEDAILKCSVTGLPPRGMGKAAYTENADLVKPFLCPKAVNAIVCQAMTWQKCKHFLQRKDPAQIRQAMQVRLNEIQTEHRRRSMFQ